MDEIMRYVFKHIDDTDKRMINIYKGLTRQNKFNKRIIFWSLLASINLYLSSIHNKKMQQEITALRKEIDELKESEGV
jgi:hypothetical protein